jgi:putative nucleotidyltransferase with HDIG domain
VSATQGPSPQDLVRALLKALLTAVRSRTFYPLRHPTVASAMRELAGALGAVLERVDDVTLAVVGREIVVDGRPLVQDGPVFDRFREDCEAHGIEKVTFLAGVRPEELEALVELLAGPPERAREQGGLAAALAARGVRGVQVGRLTVEGEESARGDAWREAEGTWSRGLDGVRAISEQIHAGRAVTGGAVREIAGLLLEGLRGQRGPMLAALALRQKSSYTFSHSLNVSLLMLAQVEMLGLTERQLEDVAAAGLLHDIGKLLIADRIIEKPGPLDPPEWEEVRRHPVYGVEVLARMRDVSDLALIVAFEHHLRHDGTGYPPRRRPWALNLVTAVAAIADCYDAMRSHRPYDPPWPCEKVYLRMTELAGTAFHPELLVRFFRIVGMYSPGTLVRLSTGDLGKVVRNHPVLLDRPVVQVLRLPGGEAPERPWLLDLALEREQRGEEAARVVESLPENSGLE